jgi:hypothetical protein
MAMAMPKVIEAYAERATDELTRAGVELDAVDPRARAVGCSLMEISSSPATDAVNQRRVS